MSIISAEEFCDATGIDRESVSALMVDMVVGAAQERVEQYCLREFEQATHTEYHDVPDKSTRAIYLRNPPINSVTSLVYDAQSGDPETVDSSDCVTDASVGKITLYDDEAYFPRDDPHGEQAVKIVYSGGYAPKDMPNAVRLAVTLLAQHYWDAPEAIGMTSQNADGLAQSFEAYEDIPGPVRALLAGFRRLEV